MQVDCFARSEPGPDLDGNEDYVIVDGRNGIFVVADGMGGRPGGAEASKIAAQVVWDELTLLTPAARLVKANLQAAVSAAHKAVRVASETDPFLKGMGTTLSAVVLVGQSGKLIHIGDSRIYRFSNGHLEKLTEDHTLAAELLARNYLSPEEAMKFPLRNVLVRAIGAKDTSEPDILEMTLTPGDLLLLATDGLYRCLPEGFMESLLKATTGYGAEKVCQTMMTAALDASPEDNLTLAVVRVPEARKRRLQPGEVKGEGTPRATL